MDSLFVCEKHYWEGSDIIGIYSTLEKALLEGKRNSVPGDNVIICECKLDEDYVSKRVGEIEWTDVELEQWRLNQENLHDYFSKAIANLVADSLTIPSRPSLQLLWDKKRVISNEQQ